LDNVIKLYFLFLLSYGKKVSAIILSWYFAMLFISDMHHKCQT